VNFEKGCIPWNKGLTKSISPELREIGKKISLAKRGLINQPQPCACGCGQLTKQKRKFIRGHNLRIKNPVDKPEARRKISKTWFKKGERISIKTEFKSGNIPWWIERGLPHPSTNPEVRRKMSKTWFDNLEGPWICSVCGKEFDTIASLGGHVSANHSNGAKDLLKWIEENGAWNKGTGNPDPYGYEFAEELKKKVRDFYGRRCVSCGIPEGETDFKLDVHHIDGIKKNNNFDNLIPLCKSCHTSMTNQICKKVKGI